MTDIKFLLADLSVELHWWLSFELMSGEISVVTGGDVVIRQWMVHISLIKCVTFQSWVWLIQQVASKSFKPQNWALLQLGMRFMKINQTLDSLNIKRFSLVIVEEVLERLGRNHHVFAGVESWRIVKNAANSQSVVDFLFFWSCFEVNEIMAAVSSDGTF